MSRAAPEHIPLTVARFAVRHQIPLKLVREHGDWYYAAGDDTTRTANPRACHALALCRRYLARQG